MFLMADIGSPCVADCLVICSSSSGDNPFSNTEKMPTITNETPIKSIIGLLMTNFVIENACFGCSNVAEVSALISNGYGAWSRLAPMYLYSTTLTEEFSATTLILYVEKWNLSE